ncbi:MAG TPA: carboxylating nicotinate-nucleotide diphosphorylase [Syntrophus sp. (in: bacteria)]|jgi:nicotinate-nucleotide pyrophosphorylase (carboxylating)|nr:carboxylating nicotinate-nucleotide diphosphorylase [Syntrophus sp. (in: bacteria)]
MEPLPLNDYDRARIRKLICNALEEDIGAADVTSNAILTGEENGAARTIAKSGLVVAGGEVFRETFRQVDPKLIITILAAEGQEVGPGTLLAEISGSLKSILMAERTALNLLQRMCGIATATRAFVRAIAGTEARILDTRKTAPGLRFLDKYSVRIGGGQNHRFALYDGVLIKDNHIAAAEGITEAVRRARRGVAHTLKIEVEVRNLGGLEEALAAGADVIMLDNMGTDDMKTAVAATAGRVPLEASGNVTLDNVRAIAATGVNFISVGALTHSVRAADISLLIQ